MAEAQQHGRRQDRPLSVTLVILGVLLIGLANGWRALGLVRQSSLLLKLGATPDPRLCAVSALAWAILFVGLSFALWRRKRYTRWVVPIVLLLYGLHQLFLPGVCAQANQAESRSPVIIFMVAAALLFVALALNSGSGRTFFENRPLPARQSRDS
jgi:hypothetical protein